MYRSPAEIPRARLPLLDQVTIKTPCRESWDGMTGDDRMRFCARCSKNVYDLSAMTQDEAETFLATHLDDEDACVRLYRRPDGRVLTSECVQGARTRHARKVTAGVAAGLCATVATTLALANVHVPEGMNLPKPRERAEVRWSIRAGGAAPVDPDTVAAAGFAAAHAHDLWGTRKDDVTGHSMGAMGFAPNPSPAREKPRPIVREVKAAASAGLPVDVIRRIVRQSYGRIALCFESGLRAHPDLAGEIAVRFIIARDGSVAAAAYEDSTLAESDTQTCIVRQFANMAFPMPDPARPVTVSYRLLLKPAP